MKTLLIRLLKKLLFALSIFLAIYLLIQLVHTKSDEYEFDYQEIEEEDDYHQPHEIIEDAGFLFPSQDESNKKYNFSFEGFNPHFVGNLKRIFDYQNKLGNDYFQDKDLNNTPIVIWWTPLTMDMGTYKKCGAKRTCYFTNARKYHHRPEDKAFLFYGTDFSLHDLPLPRQLEHDLWGLLHEESPKNNYLFSFESIIELFNYTSTFKRQSDMPLLTQYLTSIEDLESRKFLVSTGEKNRAQKELGLAPIAYIQSDCITPSDRDIFVKALMKHIKIDSFGKCLHNKDLPQNLTVAVQSMSSEEFYRIVAKYKFVLAMENAVCEDYVTEKLWRSFYIGAVPIVYGSVRAKEIYPSEKSAIEILDFRSANELANFLHELNQNDAEYEEYLSFKRENGVKNKLLLDLMSQRKWGINNDRVRGNYIDHFECLVCNRLHENAEKRRHGRKVEPTFATKEHYGCPRPYTFSEDGVLLNESNRNRRDWKESSFVTSYEIANAEQKIFFEKYYSKNDFNFTYKSLRKQALKLHFDSAKNSNKNDLK